MKIRTTKEYNNLLSKKLEPYLKGSIYFVIYIDHYNMVVYISSVKYQGTKYLKTAYLPFIIEYYKIILE